jgi:transposase-like protein
MKRYDPEARQEFGDLHKLLKRIFPEHRTARDNVFDVKRLASELGMTAEAIYKWLRQDSLPPKRARQLVELANAGLKKPVVEIEDFLPHLD